MSEEENIPSYAPSNSPENNLTPESNPVNVDAHLQEENNVNDFNGGENNREPNQNFYKKPKKSKKKIIIPLIVVLVIALGAEAYMFFIGNKNYDNVNSYQHWFGNKNICQISDKSSLGTKPNGTKFFNQMCSVVGDFNYVSSSTNPSAMAAGAVEAYTITYKTADNKTVTLVAATFNDSGKLNLYSASLAGTITNSKKIWTNNNSVYAVSSDNAADVTSFYNLLNV